MVLVADRDASKVPVSMYYFSDWFRSNRWWLAICFLSSAALYIRKSREKLAVRRTAAMCECVWVWLTYGDKHTISAYHRLVNSLRIDACSWKTVAAPRLQRMQPNQIGIKRNHSETRECVCEWRNVCAVLSVSSERNTNISLVVIDGSGFRQFNVHLFVCVCDDDDEVTKLWSGECGNGVFEWISARQQQQQHCEAHKPVLTCADGFRIFFFQFTFDSIKSKSDVIHCCCRDFGAEFYYFYLFVVLRDNSEQKKLLYHAKSSTHTKPVDANPNRIFDHFFFICRTRETHSW